MAKSLSFDINPCQFCYYLKDTHTCLRWDPRFINYFFSDTNQLNCVIKYFFFETRYFWLHRQWLIIIIRTFVDNQHVNVDNCFVFLCVLKTLLTSIGTFTSLNYFIPTIPLSLRQSKGVPEWSSLFAFLKFMSFTYRFCVSRLSWNTILCNSVL